MNEFEFELLVRVEIRRKGNYNESLQVEERATVTAKSFLEVAKILGQFHDLTMEMEKANK